MAAPAASIVICTYNRCDVLRDALASLLASLGRATGTHEVLVINNACTDATDATVAAISALFPRAAVRVIHESQPGLSHARNAGLRHAAGEVIVFIDDDVIVPDGWLDHLLAGFTLGDHVGCVGGRILLRFPDDRPPAWMNRKIRDVLSQYDLGDRSRLLSPGAGVVGANMAITRAAVRAVGEFDAQLGRKQHALLCGEEIEYIRQISRAGFQIAYSAEGYLHHIVPPERLRFGYLLVRYYALGVTMALRQCPRWYQRLARAPKLLLTGLAVALCALTGSRALLYPRIFSLVKQWGWLVGNGNSLG